VNYVSTKTKLLSNCACDAHCQDECHKTRWPILTQQDITDLRALISIAAWIRSEQLAQVGKIITTNVGPDRVDIDTRDLDQVRCNAELAACQQWWKKLTELGELPRDSIPSWSRK
jgi:hypothetical protein